MQKWGGILSNIRKGFTLIELLAVIVILAIISLIATPIVLNIVNDAKKSAALDSAYGYIEAVENKVALSSLDQNGYEDKEGYGYDEIKVNIKGTKPTGGLYTLKNGQITEGQFCINGYVVDYKDSKAKINNNSKCTSESLKLDGSLKLSSNSGQYSYPETRTIEVIENKSEGNLSCISSDTNIATCTIEENKITVESGKEEGTAILTIKSAATSKYKEAQAVYVVTTEKGLLSITANGYEGIYDKESHGIIVKSENSIIKYGEEEGNYNLEESPKYIDVGEYTVYYQITREGYKTITGSKNVIITKAEGEIELEEKIGVITYKESKEIVIKKNTSEEELTIEKANEDIVEIEQDNNKIKIIGKKIGKTIVKLTSKETKNYKSATKEYEVEVVKANNTLKLSSNIGTYTYPNSGTFEVTENTSGGSLSCTSSNSSIATCSVSGTKVTVKPGTTKGVATLTIKSSATENYNEGQAAHVVTTEEGLLSVTATGYEGIYDGKSHGITVQSSGATIKYGTSSGTYNLSESPTYKDVGTYTIYYQVSKAGYKTVTGSKTVVITKAEGSVVAPTSKTLTYTGKAQTLINAGSTSTGTIQYKLGTGSYSTSLPTATNAGTYTVYYKVVGDSNHKDVEEKSITVTINKATLSYTAAGYEGIYDGLAHGIVVQSSGAIIKYGTSSGTYNLSESPTYKDVGTYIVYYEITREGYVTVEGSKKIVITKANNTLKLSSNVGTYTYPNSGTFEVTENTSGGSLSCTSSDTSIVTCSINGNKVTVTPGTTKGVATLTIKSSATTNYNEAQVAHVVTTEEGLLSVTATGYEGVYDEKSHGIVVQSSGATIKYGTSSGNYTLTSSPIYKDVGTYTIYYQVSKAGYKTVTGSKKVIITKAEGSVVAPTSKTLTYTGKAQTLINAGSTSTGTIQYKLGTGSYSTSLPTATNAGTYTVYYKVVGDKNHKDIEEKSIIILISGATSESPDVTKTKGFLKIIYLDPTDLTKICNSSNITSVTGTKTGCMKWYAYKDEEANYTMILDHNTTSKIAWNSENKNTEMKEAQNELNKLITESKWIITPRLITIDEIIKITGNTSFDGSRRFFFETNGYEFPTTYNGMYSWLYDYTKDCINYGCKIENSNTTGYWTSSKVSGTSDGAWHVFGYGNVDIVSVNYSDTTGIRPVITVPKNLIS